MRTISPLINLIVLVLLTAIPSDGLAQNTCLDCHSAQLDPWLRPIYRDWAASPHAEEGVTCDRCHDGDPTSSNTTNAHSGVLGRADPNSKIHSANIVNTCGECHKEIAKAYTLSKHYQNLMAGKLAPDCRTCMGSHDVTLDPAHMVTCEKCMTAENGVNTERLMKGKSAYAMLTATRKQITEAEKLLRMGRQGGLDLTNAQEELEKAKVGMVRQEVKWHSFNPEIQIPELMKAYHSAALSGELAAKALQGPSLPLSAVVVVVLLAGTSLVLGGVLIARRVMRKQSHKSE